MPTPQITRKAALRFFEAVEQALREGCYPPGDARINGRDRRSAVQIAAKKLHIKRGSAVAHYHAAVRVLGREPDWSECEPVEGEAPAQPRSMRPMAPAIDDSSALTRVLDGLKKRPLTLVEIAELAGITKGQALDALEGERDRGINLHQLGDKWSIEKAPPPSWIAGTQTHEYVSRKDNTFLFGVTTDNHMGSKYERLDVVEDLYDRFVRAGVDRAFNCGNWIDGEASFNRYDLHVHGMQPQLKYLAEHFPRRDGIETYAVAGDDHEGWFTQREGVNIGRAAQHAMRDIGRVDWHDLGYMEAHIRLVNANSGKTSVMAVVHPGGGSAYALSYSIQKIIESLEGGEKPAVGLYGHYHKLWAGNIRNVWCLQAGCTQDQTPFMRKKRLEAHVGGAIVELEQDPKSGAIIAMTPKLIRYFNRGFYSDRWSHSDEVTLPERAA